MNKKVISGMLVVLVAALMLIPGASAYNTQENACTGCHAPPPNSMSITTDISSITVSPGQSFNVVVTWSGGDPLSSTEVKWPNNVLNNAMFTFNPRFVYPATTSGTQTVAVTTPLTLTPGAYTLRVYVSTGGKFETAYHDITVTVQAPPPSPVLTTVTISPLNTTVVAGNEQQFTAATLDQNNAQIGATLSWSNSNTTVGTINSTGMFKASAAGTTTVTVTATNGSVTRTATTTVTVQDPIQISMFNVTFMVKDTGGYPIQGASVVMNGIKGMTDVSGKAVLNVAQGTYKYTVTIRGYKRYTNITVVNADMTIPVTLVHR